MSDLGEKIRMARGTLSQTHFAKKTGVSLRTICKIEAGEPVRLETLRKIASALRLPEVERLQWTVDWLKFELAEDFRKFNIEPKGPPAPALRDAEHLPARIQLLVNDLPRKSQEQVHLLLQRPEVLRCLPPLNDLYDALKKSE